MACGACQFLRRKCAQSCIFAPYFSSKETGSDQFRVIHSVFGTRHFAKLLLEVPEDQRHVAASTILFEAESRVRYPIHGCYKNIYALREEAYVLPFTSLGFFFQLREDICELSFSIMDFNFDVTGSSIHYCQADCVRSSCKEIISASRNETILIRQYHV